MRTHEEIKKGLLHCWEDGCADCPYYDDCGLADHFTQIARDSLAYIQQLESRLAQVERERDAMLLDLKEIGCGVCKHAPSENDIYIHNKCHDCVKQCNFEWRGVCPENTEEEEKE